MRSTEHHRKALQSYANPANRGRLSPPLLTAGLSETAIPTSTAGIAPDKSNRFDPDANRAAVTDALSDHSQGTTQAELYAKKGLY
ncbi:MAG: hypothetical protein ACRCVV_21035 [Shewanella sp.]